MTTDTKSVQICIGRVGTGKTYHCLAQYAKTVISENPAILIVPTVEHVSRMRDMLMAHFLPNGAFSLSLLTLDQCMQSCVASSGAGMPISPLRRDFLLEQLVRSLPFTYFSAAHYCDGFVPAIGRVIRELKSQRVTVAGLRDAIQQCVGHPIIAKKWGDVLTVYEAYQKALREGDLLDEEDVLARYCLSERTPDTARGPVVFIDGFFDFTHAQLVFLERFSQEVNALTVTVTAEQGNDLFALGNDTLNRLHAVFRDAHICTFDEQRRSYGVAMQHFEKHIFMRTGVPVGESGQDIAVLYATSPYDEIKQIAHSIKARILAHQCAYNDVALIFRTVDPYLTILRDVFEEYRIPIHIHERYRIRTHVSVHALMLFLRIWMKGIVRDDIVAYIKALPGRFDQRASYECDRFFECAYRGEAGEDLLTMIAGASDLNEDISEEFKRLAAYHADITSAHTIVELVDTIKNIIFAEGMFSDAIEDYSAEDLEVMRRLDEIFEELRTVYLETMDVQQSLEIVYAVIDASLYSYSARTSDAVQVYNVGNAKQKEYRVVYMAGMLEGIFPQAVNDDVLLKSDERALLIPAGITLSQKVDYRKYEKYLFYVTATRALESLVLTCPQCDESGKPLESSTYLEEVERCLGGAVSVQRKSRSHVIPSYADVFDVRDLWFRCVYDQSRGRARGLHAALDAAGYSYALRKSVSPDAYAVMKFEDPNIVGRSQQQRGPFSASQLELYLQCPYRYFLSRMARIREPEGPIDARKKGSVIHAVLERFFDQSFSAGQEKQGWLLLQNFERACAEVVQLFNEEVASHLDVVQEMPLMRVYLGQMLSNILRMLRSEAETERVRKTTPALFEYAFGTADTENPALAITCDDGNEYSFQGIIDRIDLLHKENIAMIIDYKGSKKLDAKKFVAGEELQLLLYMKYVREVLGYTIGGAELYSYKSGKRDGMYAAETSEYVGVGKTRRLFTDASFAEIEARFKEHLTRSISGIRNAVIDCKPRDCDFCEYNAICRFDKWRLLVLDDDTTVES